MDAISTNLLFFFFLQILDSKKTTEKIVINFYNILDFSYDEFSYLFIPLNLSLAMCTSSFKHQYKYTMNKEKQMLFRRHNHHHHHDPFIFV